MFAPSFVTAMLIKRVGATTAIVAGTVLYVVSILTSLNGASVASFWIALSALGVGWNFLWVGATTMLAGCHEPEEKAKVQAWNDSVVFALVAVASLGAGALHETFGWRPVNYFALVPLSLIALALLWLLQHNAVLARKARARALAEAAAATPLADCS
jgi:MFS family permease